MGIFLAVPPKLELSRLTLAYFVHNKKKIELSLVIRTADELFVSLLMVWWGKVQRFRFII